MCEGAHLTSVACAHVCVSESDVKMHQCIIPVFWFSHHLKPYFSSFYNSCDEFCLWFDMVVSRILWLEHI